MLRVKLAREQTLHDRQTPETRGRFVRDAVRHAPLRTAVLDIDAVERRQARGRRRLPMLADEHPARPETHQRRALVPCESR